MEEKNCPCCENNCSQDQLSCGRGRAYFNNNAQSGGHGGKGAHGGHGISESSDEVVNLLLKCGHTLHHGHGGEVSISCLTAKEREQLVSLLQKCLNDIANK